MILATWMRLTINVTMRRCKIIKEESLGVEWKSLYILTERRKHTHTHTYTHNVWINKCVTILTKYKYK